jgi:ATP-dependent DNA helicase RecG
MNAFCHADYRLSGPILVKQYADKIEMSNVGGFIGGISPDNILHHPPAARNPRLVEALAKLRLINRSNLGIQRIYSAFLIEGKRPPLIREIGESVCVTFLREDISSAFRAFVAEEAKHGRMLNVDQLLLLNYLVEHAEIDTATAVTLCQRLETHVWKLRPRMC